MNKSERFAVLHATTDIRVLRESIANDIHRAMPVAGSATEALTRALQSVNLLAQIVHELRVVAKAEPMFMSDVVTPPPAGELTASPSPREPQQHVFEVQAYDAEANDVGCESRILGTFDDALALADRIAAESDDVVVDQVQITHIVEYPS